MPCRVQDTVRIQHMQCIFFTFSIRSVELVVVAGSVSTCDYKQTFVGPSHSTALIYRPRSARQILDELNISHQWTIGIYCNYFGEIVAARLNVEQSQGTEWVEGFSYVGRFVKSAFEWFMDSLIGSSGSRMTVNFAEDMIGCMLVLTRLDCSNLGIAITVNKQTH